MLCHSRSDITPSLWAPSSPVTPRCPGLRQLWQGDRAVFTDDLGQAIYHGDLCDPLGELPDTETSGCLERTGDVVGDCQPSGECSLPACWPSQQNRKYHTRGGRGSRMPWPLSQSLPGSLLWFVSLFCRIVFCHRLSSPCMFWLLLGPEPIIWNPLQLLTQLIYKSKNPSFGHSENQNSSPGSQGSDQQDTVCICSNFWRRQQPAE